MKKLSVIVLLAMGFVGYSQSHEKGNVVLNIGAGFGVYTATYDSPNDADDSRGAFPFAVFPFKAEYGLSDNVSVGVLFQRQTVTVSDAENDQGDKADVSIKGGLLAPSIVYHFNPEAKTDFYVGLAPDLTYSTWKSDDTSSSVEAKFSGIGWKLDLGARFYFGGKVSLNLNLAYNRANVNMTEYTEDGIKATNPEGNLKYAGVEPSIGLGFKI